MPKFLVVAPHSFCSAEIEERHCDRVAATAVDELKKYDIERHICDFRMSDKLRTLSHDYNRPNTDKTKWRDELRARIISEKPDFIFEIHSFPGDHEMYQRLWPGADMAIFASNHNKLFVNKLCASIKSRVPAEFNIQIVEPWHPVAITDDVINLNDMGINLKHTLFEFNEDMPKERIPILARAIYETVLDLVKQDVTSGGAREFDSATTHPASICEPRELKNMQKLLCFGAIFVVILMILVAMGKYLLDYGYNAMLPQLFAGTSYKTGVAEYNQK